MPEPIKQRILIPNDRWTPVRKEVFTDILPKLEENRAGVLFLVLYDRIRHQDSRLVRASIADLARWSGLNERTVNGCIAELREKKFVLRKKHGTKHSRTDKPLWRIPLTEFSLKDGSWVPVPRFLIRNYCKKYANAILLLVLLRYQHLSWQNFCWPGVPTLSGVVNWSETATRKALRTMLDDELWNRRETGLPRPLELVPPRPGKYQNPHYRIRAVCYERKKRRGSGFSTFSVSKPLAKRFKIKPTVSFQQS